jgi:hypothetical protein
MRNAVRLLVLAAILIAPAAFAAPANDGSWGGSWTNLLAVNTMGQVFLAESSTIWAIDVDLLTGNPGYASSDTLTLSLVDATTKVELARATNAFADGFTGWGRFAFGKKIPVQPGQKLVMYVWDTGTLLLGWKYGVDAYANGYAIQLGSGRPEYDFRFRVNP